MYIHAPIIVFILVIVSSNFSIHDEKLGCMFVTLLRKIV